MENIPELQALRPVIADNATIKSRLKFNTNTELGGNIEFGYFITELFVVIEHTYIHL